MDNQGLAPGAEAAHSGARQYSDAVEALREWPNVEQVKALKGKPGYRLRVGRYRVLFTVHAGIPLIVRIEAVKKRDEYTY